MLCVVGDLVEDIVVRLAGPIRPDTDTTARIARRPGGSGAAVARAAAFAAPGEPVRFIGRVGDDATGRALAADLAEAGVDVRVQYEGRTGTVVVLVDTAGERTMLTDRGAAVALAHMPDTFVDDVTVVHLPSYSLFAEPIGTTSAQLVARVHAAGGRLSVDASSTGLISDVGVAAACARYRALAPDLFLANEDEARLLGIGAEWRGVLVVKHGADPVEIVMAGCRRTVAVPAIERGTDTTGAGDAFAGGLLALWSSGADIVTAVEAGVTAAHEHLRARAEARP